MAEITIKHTATYQCSAETVFAALTDVDLEPKWQPNLLRIWHEPAGPIGEGAVISRERKIMGKPATQVSVVVAFEPPTRLEMRDKPGVDQQPFRISYSLVPLREGVTRLEFVMVIAGVPGLFASPVRKRLTGEVSGQFNLLGDLLAG